jgi:ectoine hydroxylase-related dioxygenase (phytanoyl-CoA dioxygenase family)
MSVVSNAQVEQFQTNGYLIVRQLVDSKTVEVLKGALMAIIDGQDGGIRRKLPVQYLNGTKVTEFQGLWKTNPVFTDFIKNSKLGEAAAQLMDTREVRLLYDQMFHKEAILGGAVACHQDYDYWRYVSTPNMLTAWMALSSVTRESGCVYFIPGSHRWGLIERFGSNIMKDTDPELLLNRDLSQEQKDLVTREPAILEPGDVSFHHSLVIHCSYPNISKTTRLGYIHRYIPSDARYVESHDIHKSHEIEVKDGEPIRGANFPLVWPRR